MASVHSGIQPHVEQNCGKQTSEESTTVMLAVGMVGSGVQSSTYASPQSARQAVGTPVPVPAAQSGETLLKVRGQETPRRLRWEDHVDIRQLDPKTTLLSKED